jgi:hypothetical protein
MKSPYLICDTSCGVGSQTSPLMIQLRPGGTKPEWTSNIQAKPVEAERVAALKPRLLVENCNPDHTVAALRDVLSEAGSLYGRGVPVRLAFDQIKQGILDGARRVT